MTAFPNSNHISYTANRRSFLWSLAGLGLGSKGGKSEKRSETVYRFLTPKCQVRMSVQSFGNSEVRGFHFRDNLANRAFCLDANGNEDRNCLERFSGSMAIARYSFHSRQHSKTPRNVRERVLTIDHDSRINPRPPFERTLSVEREMVSDIQAFGYNPDDPQWAGRDSKTPAVWCLLRQDLYFDNLATAFLVVHWKHTLDLISLLDVIPAGDTQMIHED